MARGKLITGKVKKDFEDFVVVDDLKLRMSITALADKYDEGIRDLIYRTYNDPHIMSIYRQIRASGIYEQGGKSKVHKKILQFPNAYVFDFVDTVMTAMYDEDWMYNKTALKHDLVRPWWTVNKI